MLGVCEDNSFWNLSDQQEVTCISSYTSEIWKRDYSSIMQDSIF